MEAELRAQNEKFAENVVEFRHENVCLKENVESLHDTRQNLEKTVDELEGCKVGDRDLRFFEIWNTVFSSGCRARTPRSPSVRFVAEFRSLGDAFHHTETLPCPTTDRTPSHTTPQLDLEHSVLSLQSSTDDLQCTNAKLGSAVHQLEHQINFLKNMQTSMTNHLLESTTPQMAEQFTKKIEQALHDDTFLSKLVLPLEETQEKYEKTLTQFENLQQTTESYLEKLMNEQNERERRDERSRQERRVLQNQNADLLKKLQSLLGDLGKFNEVGGGGE